MTTRLTRASAHLLARSLLLFETMLVLGCTTSDPDKPSEAAAAETATVDAEDSDAGRPPDDAANQTALDAGATAVDTSAGVDDASCAAPTDVVDHLDVIAPAPIEQKKVTLPFGETLFFDGDDYLWSWGLKTKQVTVVAKPTGASATVVGDAPGRLTPDKPGMWRICRSDSSCLDINVKDNFLNEDTFLNYNYSPTRPIATKPAPPGQLASHRLVWVTATTSNAVQAVKISSDSAQQLATIATGSWPTAIAWSSKAGAFLVTQCGRDSLGFLDPDEGRLTDAIKVGNEPANVVVDDAFAYVALSGEDRVAKVDLTSRKVVATVEVGRDPRAMALATKSKRLYVLSLLSSNQHPRGLLNKPGETLPEKTLRDVAVVDTQSFTVKGYAKEVGTILRGAYLRPDQPNKLLVAYTKANNDKPKIDADATPHQHMLAVVDTAKAEQTGSSVEKVVNLDKLQKFTGPAPSPYTMQLGPNANYLVVTLSAGRAIMLLHPKTYAELGRITVGHDPRGLLFFGGRIWTYAWLSNELQGVALPSAPVLTEMQVSAKKKKKILWAPPSGKPPVKIVIGDDPTPDDVKAGQRIFNDAAFSKHGDFSCNNCHIDGITDGLVWDLLVDGSVNTLAFRNVGGTGPFLWGGQLPTLFDFSREVLKLVGAEATGKQMEDLTTYMQSVTAPPNPYTLPGGRLTDAAKAGAKIYYGTSGAGGAGCGTCHGGPLYTNTATVDGKTKGKKTDVPSLLGTYDTGPWGRESQWWTLKDMVDYAAEFTAAGLDGKQRDNLLAFVRQLPGDRLYLTSATPLHASKYVWPETKIELQFSALIEPGQESALLFRELSEKGPPKPVAGSWTISGRYARFKSQAKLAKQTKYEVAVSAALVGQLGEKLEGPLQLVFATGSTPLLDVSGKWSVTLEQALIGKQSAQLAFLQAKGGQVTGALLTKFQQGDIENGSVEGHVSGHMLVLHPFYLDTSFGKFFVQEGITASCKDTQKDGYADECAGSFPFKFSGTTYTIKSTFKRQSLPKP